MVKPHMADVLERLKILLNSSTPIIVMETVEEMRAVRLVRVACSSLNLATFEWSIASGLVRCGSDVGELVPDAGHLAISATGYDSHDVGAQGLYNSKEPAQALSNLEAMSLEAAFVLKDFHRHMDDPVVVRRLRDVGQKFSANRRTVIITAPAITIPPELASLVEFLELPLPDNERLRDLIRETYTRMAGTLTLKLQLDAPGVDAMAANLRGLTEEEAERAISQSLVARYALAPACINGCSGIQ